MNLIQQKQVQGLYDFIQNNAGGTTDGSLIDPSLVVYLSGDQTITGGKVFNAGITGGSSSMLDWTSGNFSYLYSEQLYGMELTGDYGKIGTTSFTDSYLSGTQAIFTNRITGTNGFLFTGAHATDQTCDIHNTKLQIYSDLNAGTNNTAAIFGRNPLEQTPTMSFATYSGDESAEAGYLRKTALFKSNQYSQHLNITNTCPTGDIRFSTYGDNGGLNWYRIDELQRMIIHSGGNVGIGVKGMGAGNQSIKPLEKLHVSGGNILTDGNIYVSGELWITGSDGTPMQITGAGGGGGGGGSFTCTDMNGCSPTFVGVTGQIVSGNLLKVNTDAYISGELWITGNDGAPLQLTGNGGGGGASFTCTDMNGCSPTFVGVTGQIVSGNLLKVNTDAYISGELWITGNDGAPLQLTGNGGGGGASFTCTDMNGCSPTFVGVTGQIVSGNSIKGADLYVDNLFVTTETQLTGTTYSQAIIPHDSGVWDLGSASKPWQDIYLTSSSIYLGDQKVTATGGNLIVERGGTTSSIPSMAVVDVTSTNAYTLLPSDNGKMIHVNPGNDNPTAITLPVGDSDFDNFKCLVRHLDSDDPYIGFKTSDGSAVQGSATGFTSNWAWASVYRGEGSWYIFGDPLVNRAPPSPPNPELLTDGLVVRLFGWNDPSYTDNSDFVDDATVNPGDGTPATHDVYKSTIALPGGGYVSGVLNNMSNPDAGGDEYIETVSDGTISKKAIQLDGTNDFISMPQLQNNADGNWNTDLSFLTGNSSDSASDDCGWTVLLWLMPSADLAATSYEYKPFHLGEDNHTNSVGLFNDFYSTDHPAHIRGDRFNKIFSNTLTDPPTPWDETYAENWTFMAISYNGGVVGVGGAQGDAESIMVGIGTGNPANNTIFFYSGDGAAPLDGNLEVDGADMADRGEAGQSWLELTNNYCALIGAQLGADGSTLPSDNAYWPGWVSDYRIYNRDLATGEMYRIFTGQGNV